VIQDSTLSTVTSHITGARFSTYLAHAGNDPRHALKLYRWNILMSGALQESLGIAEVFLRNTLDPQLQAWNSAQPPRLGNVYGANWIQNPAGPLWTLLNPGGNGRRRRSVYQQAFNRALQDQRKRPPTHRRHRHAVDHNDVLAQLSFGTWDSLLPRKDSVDPSGIGPEGPRKLWTEALHLGFPHHPDPIAVKYWVERLYRLRNRVAHLEPLCDTDVLSYHRTTARLLRSIDPAIAEWYSGISRVPAVYRSKPTFP